MKKIFDFIRWREATYFDYKSNLKNSPIILLDEATAYTDPKTKGLFNNQFPAWFRAKH